jgi:hypothetical protein
MSLVDAASGLRPVAFQTTRIVVAARLNGKLIGPSSNAREVP